MHCLLKLSQIIYCVHNAVFCSSGGLADLLLSSVLPPVCQYDAVDQSPVQLQLAQAQLAKYGETSSCQLVFHHGCDISHLE